MALTQAEIEALKKNYNPAKGPQTVDEWLYLSGDSLNVMNNLAVANARLASAIATALKDQKDVVQEVANMIEAVSTLKNKLISYKPTNPDLSVPVSMIDPPSKATEKDKAAIRDLYNQLIGWVGADLKDDIKSKFTDAFSPTGNGIPVLRGIDYANIEAALTTRSESLSTKSSQESLRLQTLTSRYTQANEQATTVQQKDAQNKTNITNNLRGNG